MRPTFHATVLWVFFCIAVLCVAQSKTQPTDESTTDTAGKAQPKNARPNTVNVQELALGNNLKGSHINALAETKGAASGAAAVQTSSSEIAYAPATGGDCKTNDCRYPGPGCATCVAVEAPIPNGAKVVAVRCFTTAGGIPGDVPLRSVDCKADVGWSAWQPYAVTSKGFYQAVSDIYHNRSSNRIRAIKIEVDYQ